MFEGYLERLLQNALGEYIEELDKNALSVSVSYITRPANFHRFGPVTSSWKT